jgi:hypothetical protein
MEEAKSHQKKPEEEKQQQQDANVAADHHATAQHLTPVRQQDLCDERPNDAVGAFIEVIPSLLALGSLTLEAFAASIPLATNKDSSCMVVDDVKLDGRGMLHGSRSAFQARFVCSWLGRLILLKNNADL